MNNHDKNEHASCKAINNQTVAYDFFELKLIAPKNLCNLLNKSCAMCNWCQFFISTSAVILQKCSKIHEQYVFRHHHIAKYLADKSLYLGRWLSFASCRVCSKPPKLIHCNLEGDGKSRFTVENINEISRSIGHERHCLWIMYL